MHCSPLSLSFALFLLCFTPVSSLYHRSPGDNQGLSGPTTVESVTTAQSPQGTVVQTCTIILTPMTDAQGYERVVEVQECSSQIESGNTASNDGATIASTRLSAMTTSTTTQTIPGDAVPTPPAVSGGTISINSINSVTLSATPPAASPSDPVNGTDAGSAGLATASRTVQTGTAAAENASQSTSASATPFTVPGKSLQVLPIGLGIFAGISVIALIVVAVVTYERTKYRKAFRQRKLAESGAAMGYGGMA